MGKAMNRNKRALIQRLTTLLAYRVLQLTPEFWQTPILKWQLQTEMRLLAIEQLKLPEANHQAAVKLAFCKGLQDWQREHPDRDLTDEEYAWWLWYGSEIGALPDNWAINLMCETINNDYDQFIRNVEKMKQDGEIPESLPPLELAALLLNPPDVSMGKIPPGHSFWHSLGVNDAGEWHAKDGLTRLITVAKRINANARTYLRLLARKESRQGTSDKLEYVPNYTGLEPSIDDNISDLERKDERLRLLEQLKPRELDLFNAELERREAEKTREQWYGADKAQKVTQRIKYLKTKYSKH